ncbi:TetR/AcrR family transcriptional regulator [Aeromicrobium piscarium]|uniref:TetR/AcrR family transcriptional regulator n=1 Tax=Aeromicrobium piscarium TaxID=2590901 RepID=A0A554SDA0_9ACTN|nr:TetR/AcrR family transcriptional regulator [Aeromicrobium piscarium]
MNDSRLKPKRYSRAVETTSPGRPRDPAVGERITAAAVEVFARQGWSGFSLDAVARTAGVGKASIYLRWTDKEALLTDAMAAVFAPIADIDSGTLRGDLEQLALLLLTLYADGVRGTAARRIVVESEVTEAVRERWATVRAEQIATTRSIVRRAVERGELATDAPVALVLDSLCGAAMLHPVAVSAAHLTEPALARHAAAMVDFVLAGASAYPRR